LVVFEVRAVRTVQSRVPVLFVPVGVEVRERVQLHPVVVDTVEFDPDVLVGAGLQIRTVADDVTAGSALTDDDEPTLRQRDGVDNDGVVLDGLVGERHLCDRRGEQEKRHVGDAQHDAGVFGAVFERALTELAADKAREDRLDERRVEEHERVGGLVDVGEPGERLGVDPQPRGVLGGGRRHVRRETRDQHLVDGHDDHQKDEKGDVDDDEVGEHLLAAPTPEFQFRIGLFGRDLEDRCEVTARTEGVGQQRDDTGRRGRPDPQSEAPEGVVDAGAVLYVPPDAVDLDGQFTQVALADSLETLDDGHPRLVETPHPAEQFGQLRLHPADPPAVQLPDERETADENQERLDEDVVEGPDPKPAGPDGVGQPDRDQQQRQRDGHVQQFRRIAQHRLDGICHDVLDRGQRIVQFELAAVALDVGRPVAGHRCPQSLPALPARRSRDAAAPGSSRAAVRPCGPRGVDGRLGPTRLAGRRGPVRPAC